MSFFRSLTPERLLPAKDDGEGISTKSFCPKVEGFLLIIQINCTRHVPRQGQSRVLFSSCMDSQGLDQIPTRGHYWAKILH